MIVVVVDDVLAGGGGELSPSRSKVLLLVTVVVGEASTAEALFSSSWGRPVLGLWPDDWKRGIVIVNQSRRGSDILINYLGLGQWSGNRSGLRCGGLLLDAGRGNGAQDCTATASSGQRLFLALLFLKLLVDFLFPVDLEER